ncbi:hypothetical protein GA0115251_11233 [Streptomyces sp. TverLS-915]|nr:hypothetical protein GA0115251_11233 [Streptomyces sp. TverLS-915]
MVLSGQRVGGDWCCRPLHNGTAPLATRFNAT